MARRTVSENLSSGVIVVLAAMHVACSSGQDAAGAVAGIDGTGVSPTLAYGRVTAFGSVWVNGVRFNTDAAAVVIDGMPGQMSDLKVGDVVHVTASFPTENPGQTANAVTVRLDHLLIAPIDSVDPASGEFVALGQTVKLSAETAFDATLAGGIGGLLPGSSVTVSGFRNARGEIVATRISPASFATTESKTIGAVTAVGSDQQFEIGDLVIDGSGAVWPQNAAADSLSRGQVVEVWGTAQSPTLLRASRVQVKSLIEPASTGTHVEVESFVTGFDRGDPARFTLGGTPVISDGDTVIDGIVTLDAPVEVEGTLAANGAVLAAAIKSPLAAPTGSSGPHTVYGYLYDPFSGPVAGGPVNAWLAFDLPSGGQWGYTYWFIHPLFADASGRFVADSIPHNAEVTIHAHKAGYVQPCAVIVDVNQDLALDIEMMSVATLDSPAPPRPQTSTGWSLSGSVYEMTPAGRQPVVGAWIEAYHSVEVFMANTVTDQSGNYFLCNMPASSAVMAGKEGYQMVDIWPIDTSTSTTLDIELRRN